MLELLTRPWSVTAAVAALVASLVVLVVVGARFTRIVDALADRTGIGEALAGGVLLGATTSLAGSIASGVAAWRGQADLAVANSLGGIAAQTTFLAIADLAYRRANLEHAAASLANLQQALVLIGLLAIALVAVQRPELCLGSIHGSTLLLPLAYLGGLRLAHSARQRPMWWPRATPETRIDAPEPRNLLVPLGDLWLRFLGCAVVVGFTGWVVARAGITLIEGSGLTGSLVGGFVTSITTSVPELVTVVVAVRTGALTLAVADIVGGNTFDVLMLPIADLCFRGQGTIYAHVGRDVGFLLGWSMLLTVVLAAGLVQRQREGIGFEGLALIGIYLAGFLVLVS